MKKILGILLLISSFSILQASESRKNWDRAHKKQTSGKTQCRCREPIFTDHVLEQIEKRGISVKQAKQVVVVGKKTKGAGNAVIYTEKGERLEHPIMVIVDPASNVAITAYRKGLEPDSIEQELNKQKGIIHKSACEALIRLKNDKSVSTEERIKKRRAIKADEKKKQAEAGAHYAKLMKEKEDKEKAGEGSTDKKS